MRGTMNIQEFHKRLQGEFTNDPLMLMLRKLTEISRPEEVRQITSAWPDPYAPAPFWA